MRKKKGTYTLEKMRPIVAGYEFYKGKKSAYCDEYDLNRYTFDYWRNRIRDIDNKSKKSKSSKFIPVNPTASSASPTIVAIPSVETSPAFIKLHLPDGKRLELPTTISDKLLISILQIQLKADKIK